VYQNFIIPYLYEAQHVSGDTPHIIRSLKPHWQPLVFCTWEVVGRVVGGRCQAQCAWQRPPTTRPTTSNGWKPRGCQCSFRPLMMGGVSPETCWASYKYGIIKFWYTVASCWIYLHELYYDARIHEHQFPGVAWPDHGSKQLPNRIACPLILATMEEVVVSVRDITKTKESLSFPVSYQLRATRDVSVIIFTRGGYKYCDVILMREFVWQLISRRQPPSPPSQSLKQLYSSRVGSYLSSYPFGKACCEKGKAIPLQAWTGPEGSRRLRLPDFKTLDTWRWYGYQPYATGRLYPPGNIPGTHFC